MHWNVQINIQKVEEVAGTPGPLLQHPKPERRITEVLKLAVTADSEQEAYLKAHRLLTANEPIGGAQ